MNLRKVSALALLLSLLTGGCAADVDDSPSQAANTSVNPAGIWLANLWTRTGDEGKGELQSYELHADGTGRFRHDQFTVLPSSDPTVSLGDDHNVRETNVSWSSDGQSITLNGTIFPLGHTLNCRLIRIGKETYETASPHRCPFESSPLSTAEQEFAGTWTHYESGRDIVLELEVDRYARLYFERTGTQEFYWMVDARSMMHMVTPDGHDYPWYSLQRNGTRLRMCDAVFCSDLEFSESQ
jgi:hypothetical protein